MRKRDSKQKKERETERGRESKLALFFSAAVSAMSAPPAVYCQYVAIFTLYTCSPWAPLVIGHGVGGDEGVSKGEGKGCAPVNPKAGSAHRATEWNENNERINNGNNNKTLC